MSRDVIERQAKYLASENRKADPGISRVYWFPDEEEVRLVELQSDMPPSQGPLAPFYFRPNPAENLPATSSIAMIRPEEYGRLELPPDWGEWSEAVVIDDGDE